MTQLQTIFKERISGKSRNRPHNLRSAQGNPNPGRTVTLPKVSEQVSNEVKDELAKEMLKDSIEQEERLSNLTERSQKVLFHCKNVFPFDLFPDEISVEPTQINIQKKSFFFTHHLLTIPIDNIADIHVRTSPFFAAMTFIDRSFVENSMVVGFLKKNDAFYIRDLVQGLIVASKENVDVEKINPETLKKQAAQIGNMQGVSQLL